MNIGVVREERFGGTWALDGVYNWPHRKQKEKKIGKGVLGSGQVRMKAELKSFDFDYKFKITSFTMTYEGNAGVGVLTTRGSRLSADMISAVNGSRSGSKLYFSAITAKGDDGKPRRLSDLIVTLK